MSTAVMFLVRARASRIFSGILLAASKEMYFGCLRRSISEREARGSFSSTLGSQARSRVA